MLHAQWITKNGGVKENCPLFLREFTVTKPLKSATLRASARGVYEMMLNGERVGNFVMAPGWTSYYHRIQYQTYVSWVLLLADYRLSMHLAGGFYRRAAFSRLAVIAELCLQYEDGSEEIIGTDERWLVADSGLQYCDNFGGIRFDARVVPQFSEHAAVAVYDDDVQLVEQISEYVTEQERLKPIAVIHTPKGETVLDFGQNMAGVLEIAVDAEDGDQVAFSFGEVLDKDGNFYNANYRAATALYDYTCRAGRQTYKPQLTFYGFRYVRVDKWPCDLDPERFTAIVLHTDMKRTGWIETSDPMLNQLFSNVIWGQKGNYLDLPTDCPQRDERYGWTGDAQVFVRTAAYNYDVRLFFKKWLGDMALEQTVEGAIYNVVPHPYPDWLGFSPVWGDAVTICPWQLYLTYKDEDTLRMMYKPMTRWVSFIEERLEWWLSRSNYGDWLELKCPDGEKKGDTRDCMLAYAFYAHSLELVCKAGRVLGEDVTRYERWFEQAKQGFIQEYDDAFVTQGEYAVALYFDLVKDRRAVATALAQMIHDDGDKLQTGFVGTPYLLHALAQNGHVELAYTLLLRTEYPSWLYPITKGATTMWEHWDGIKPNGEMWSDEMNSFNHYAYGAVADFLYEVCGGIKPMEQYAGFEKVRFEPMPDDRLERFRAVFESLHGRIESRWWHEDGRVRYEIVTPVEAVAVIDGNTHHLKAGTYRF